MFTAFDLRKDTKFSIHDANSDENTHEIALVRKQYLTVMDVNVIMLDWRNMRGVGGIWVAGAQLTHLINYMVSIMGSSLDRIHIVGHGLGAQIAGFAGVRICKKVRRITGLDPVLLPGFDDRLDATDAKFVDVIHTAVGPNLLTDIGTANFYPTGGHHQNACYEVGESPLKTLKWTRFVLRSFCIQALAIESHCCISPSLLATTMAMATIVALSWIC